MINSLRKRFILVAMGSTMAVLLVILGGIQIFSYLKVVQQADQLLTMLGDNQGEFPREVFTGEIVPQAAEESQVIEDTVQPGSEKTEDEQSNSDEGKTEGQQSNPNEGKTEGQQSNPDGGKTEGQQSNPDEGKTEGQQSNPNEGKTEGQQSNPDEGKTEGQQSNPDEGKTESRQNNPDEGKTESQQSNPEAGRMEEGQDSPEAGRTEGGQDSPEAGKTEGQQNTPGELKEEKRAFEFPNLFEEPIPQELSPETPYRTRFFSVLLSDDGEVLETKTRNIAAVQDEDAVDFAEDIRENGEENGFYHNYRYKVVEEAEGKRIIFVDCGSDIVSLRSFFITCLAVSAIGMLIVLILVVFFSKLVFRPVMRSYEKQKQFITDASHELKTPLTIIDANTEVLEMVQGESQWTESIRNQVRRLTYLTQQMVILSRLDEGRQRGPMLDFPLSDAVAETAGEFQLPAQIKGKKMELQIENGITFHGDEAQIRQLISLLLDNAVKYSDEEGSIRLELYRKGKRPVIRVFNTVEEIEQGRLDVIFERFYRRDASRNSEMGGSGIGLSVAKAIAEAHGGKIHAVSRDGKSIEITVVL